MPDFRVPVMIEVKGQAVVEARSKTEAIKKAQDGDFTEFEINIPVDAVEATSYLEEGEEDEVELCG